MFNCLAVAYDALDYERDRWERGRKIPAVCQCQPSKTGHGGIAR